MRSGPWSGSTTPVAPEVQSHGKVLFFIISGGLAVLWLGGGGEVVDLWGIVRQSGSDKGQTGQTTETLLGGHNGARFCIEGLFPHTILEPPVVLCGGLYPSPSSAAPQIHLAVRFCRCGA